MNKEELRKFKEELRDMRIRDLNDNGVIEEFLEIRELANDIFKIAIENDKKRRRNS